MSRIDPIEQGLKQGWHHIRGSQLQQDTVLEADVVIIGSGAGGVNRGRDPLGGRLNRDNGRGRPAEVFAGFRHGGASRLSQPVPASRGTANQR